MRTLVATLASVVLLVMCGPVHAAATKAERQQEVRQTAQETLARVFNPAAGAAAEQGVYTDRANSGPVIVFYRID